LDRFGKPQIFHNISRHIDKSEAWISLTDNGNLIGHIIYTNVIKGRVERFIDKTEKNDFFKKPIQSIFDKKTKDRKKKKEKKTQKKSGKYLKLAEIAVAYKQFIFCTLAYFSV
jgi:hypothetical protein